MARENQGLQVALIIFVMLTLILGVTTFIYFRQADEAVMEAANKTEEAANNRTAANNFQEENVRLKKMIGAKETDNIQTIEDEFRKEMTTYAGTEPEETRDYRQVLVHLQNQLNERAIAIDGEKIARAELAKHNEDRDNTVKNEIAPKEAAAQKAGQDVQDERGKFNSARENFTKIQSDLAAKLEKARKEGETTVAQLQNTVDDLGRQVNAWKGRATATTEKLQQVVKETFEIADGEVTWVNQRSRTVWINLGRADSLGRQTSFSVYAGDTNDVTKSGKKGSIEVTQLLGDHVAEARIVEDSVSDPIMPGDKIYTPVWTRGEQRRFALAGIFDLDGDGKSDLDTVRNLITLNGGIVDAYMDADGKMFGKMTINTRYLVLGDPPDARSTPAVLDRNSKMVGDAKDLGIETMPVDELLNRMGWKNESRVVRFGPGANPADFRAQPPTGTNPVSSGNVSDLFRQRQPPKRTGAGSAF